MVDLVDEITSTSFAREMRHTILDGMTSQDPSYYGAEYSDTQDAGTSHISVVDERGDAVAMTR